MVQVPTYWANIYVGLVPGYGTETPHLMDARRHTAKTVIQTFCDQVKLGVTVTETRFYYVGGSEPGLIVGLINYPRFPSTPQQIEDRAIQLALELKVELRQERVSVVFPDKTIMLGEV